MRHPLVRRAFYSGGTTLVGLALSYYLLAIFPSPRLWWANATPGPGMVVQAVVMLILYGLPAWAMAYLLFGLLNIPDLDRPRRRPPAG